MSNLNGLDLFDPGSLPFIEDLMDQYVADPASVPESWRTFFDRNLQSSTAYVSPLKTQDDLVAQSRRTKVATNVVAASSNASGVEERVAHKQSAVDKLVYAYRLMGHMASNMYPVDFHEREPIKELDPATYDLGPADFDDVFEADDLPGRVRRPFRDILEHV